MRMIICRYEHLFILNLIFNKNEFIDIVSVFYGTFIYSSYKFKKRMNNNDNDEFPILLRDCSLCVCFSVRP